MAFLGRRCALEKLEFVPACVEVRDFVSCRFQSSLQIENLRARFRIKIGRGKRGLQIRHLVSAEKYSAACGWLWSDGLGRQIYFLHTRHAAGLLRGMVAVIAKRSPTQVKTEVRAIKKAGNEINKSAAAARAFLRKNGFITKKNKVSKHYR